SHRHISITLVLCLLRFHHFLIVNHFYLKIVPYRQVDTCLFQKTLLFLSKTFQKSWRGSFLLNIDAIDLIFAYSSAESQSESTLANHLDSHHLTVNNLYLLPSSS